MAVDWEAVARGDHVEEMRSVGAPGGINVP